jgi:hypothetical protein
MNLSRALTLHTPGISKEAKMAVGIAIAYAQLNEELPEHKMSVFEFRRLTLLGYTISHRELQKMVIWMGRATCTLRITDLSVKPKRQLVVSSRGVFRSLVLIDSEVRFSVSPSAWGDLSDIFMDAEILREIEKSPWQC